MDMIFDQKESLEKNRTCNETYPYNEKKSIEIYGIDKEKGPHEVWESQEIL